MNAFVLLFVLCIPKVIRCEKLKKTTLEFYLHDTFSGANKTVLQVAGPGSTTNLQFGLVAVVDDLITEGSSIGSKALGRMQGSYSSSSLDGLTLFVSFSAVLQNDLYNGSLSILGTNRIILPTRSVPVVGGTGDFEGAHGLANVQTVSFDETSATLHYTIQIEHLDKDLVSSMPVPSLEYPSVHLMLGLFYQPVCETFLFYRNFLLYQHFLFYRYSCCKNGYSCCKTELASATYDDSYI